MSHQLFIFHSFKLKFSALLHYQTQSKSYPTRGGEASIGVSSTVLNFLLKIIALRALE